MLLPVSFFLIIFSSTFVVAQCRLQLKTAYLLAIFLTSWAQIVLISQLASLVHQLNLPFYFILQILIFVATGYLWKRNGSHNLLGPLSSHRLTVRNLKELAKKHPALAIWLIFTAIVYAFMAVLILTVPQNNYDSMTYHLSRVGYWLQHQSLAPWLTPNPRQTTFPINAELGVLWTVLFSGNDRWSGLIQWVCALVIVTAVFGIARLLSASHAQAVFASLLFACFPGILLQSTTTQNDLVVSAFFMCCLYFLFLGQKEHTRIPIFFSALGISLSIGTKSTVFFILPAFAICLLVDILLARFRNFRFYLTWVGLSLAAFLFFGAFGYIQNQIAYGNPLSDKVWTQGIINTPVSKTTLVTANTVFYTYQLLDFSGIPEPAASFLVRQKSWLFSKIINHLPVPAKDALPDQSLSAMLNTGPTVHEDTTWYGFIAFLVLIPAVIYQFTTGLRSRQTNFRWMLVALGVGFMLTFSALIYWSPYKGRYFILPIAVVTPLTYFFYSEKKNRPIAWIIAVLSMLLAASIVANNSTKPLVGPNAIWNQDRLTLQTLTNASMKEVIQLVDAYVPQNSTLATRLEQDDWDYPFFGRNLSRKIVQLDPYANRIDAAQARSMKADYLLIDPMKRTFLQQPDGLEFTGEANGWLLFKILPQGTVSTTASPDFSGITDARQLVFLDPQFTNRVGVILATSSNWGVETYQGHGVFWIGEKSAQGLQIYLWSEETARIDFTFQLAAGSGLPDPLRQMTFSHWFVEPYLEVPHLISTQPYQLNGEAQATFAAELQPGLNKIVLYCNDEATVRSQPNGDQRPLLVLVNRVDVSPEAVNP
ncbi:MAG TPA: glycosyltransferase family 39 protein [Longilinea sp.]|nr:glycosyltransferase family 39 protein [Longilinea sp.]